MGLAALDASGRVADSGIVCALDCVPGTRLHIHEGASLVVVRADRQGVFPVTGHAHLPAAVREWCELTASDRVLLVRLLVAHPCESTSGGSLSPWFRRSSSEHTESLPDARRVPR